MSLGPDRKGVAQRAWWQSDGALIGFFALLKVAINGSVITRYGFQRDELYFIDCGRHLSFGYVDHGPMVPWIARLTQIVFGDSLLALRLPSLAAGALAVILAGLLAREMGGKRWVQAFTCAAMIAAPAYLRMHSILHIPTFEVLYWTGCFLVLARIINTGNEKLWLLLGVIAGFGILNKPTVLFFGTGVAAALVLTRLRQHLRRPWVYAGGAIALLIFLPNIVWQYQHDWATYRFVKELNQDTMRHISFAEFMLGQVLYMGPLNVFVWAPGLYYLAISKHGANYRALGVICVAVFAIFVIAKAKVYYLAPAYPALFAGGALAWWRAVENRAWLRRAAFALPVVGFFWTAPLGLPVLDIERAPGAIRAMTGGILDEDSAYEITGDWRDQFGWEHTVEAIAAKFHSLTPEEQKDCIIFTGDYGLAGAIDFFGGKYGLPSATCTSMTYYYWGPGERSGRVALAMRIAPENLALYADAARVATIFNEHAGQEREIQVLLCRNPAKTIHEAWKTIRHNGF